MVLESVLIRFVRLIVSTVTRLLTNNLQISNLMFNMFSNLREECWRSHLN